MARKLERSRPSGQQLPTLTPQVEAVRVADAPARAPRATRTETPEVPESVSTEVPKWRQLERKETRLRGDQLEQLASLRRRLSAARSSRDDRITDNTLIRVAVDLLLTHADQLAGDTEDELRRSVT